MAVAIIFAISDIESPVRGNIDWTMEVAYSGVDVPDQFHRDTITFRTSNSITAAQLASAAASAVQANATTLGYTVAAGATLLPSFSKV